MASDQQQEQEILEHIERKDKELDQYLQGKYEKRSQTLAQKLLTRLSQCVNAGKPKIECEKQYLQQEPNIIQAEQKFNQCMSSGAFPINKDTKKTIDQCFKTFTNDLDQSLHASLNKLQDLLK